VIMNLSDILIFFYFLFKPTFSFSLVVSYVGLNA
jgi:hypothetical protein